MTLKSVYSSRFQTGNKSLLLSPAILSFLNTGVTFLFIHINIFSAQERGSYFFINSEYSPL